MLSSRDRKPKLEAPLFLKSIGDCEVFPGMQARFTGCVAGNPEPECEWYRNDVRIYPRWATKSATCGRQLIAGIWSAANHKTMGLLCVGRGYDPVYELWGSYCGLI